MSYTIFFDFETGGLLPTHPPIQLASIVMKDEDWSEVASFQAKLQFEESTADPEALKMNHYDRDLWQREAIPAPQALSRFVAYAKPFLCIQMTSKSGSPYSVGKLAGHNALTFDLPILKRLFGSSFFPFSYHVKDTLQRALWFYDEHPEITRPANLKLTTLADSLGVPTDSAHDALTDCRLSAAIARAFWVAERAGFQVAGA